MALTALVLAACSDMTDDLQTDKQQPKAISLSGSIQQQNVTRADEQGFVTGDRMGVYIVDYEEGQPGTLHATDNRASNLAYTFDGDNYRWTASTPIYWRDRETPVDVYAYYPLANYISQPTVYNFEVQADQSLPAQNGDLATYEQSDLLWGKQTKVSPTEDVIIVKLQHRLAGVRAMINKGEGISDTEWQKLDKIVLIENTVHQATVDLSTGQATASEGTPSPIRMAAEGGYRAIVIPQTVAAGKTLLSVTLDGQTYTHSLTTAMQYQAGKLHNFTITVNKSAITGDYEISVTDDGISPWVNDETSHQFSSQTYVIVDCPEPGKLKESIAAAGLDYQTIQNLKITGEITNEDFSLLSKEMPELKHLNLKDVTIRRANTYRWEYNDREFHPDHAIPAGAFYGNKTLRSIVLPSNLKRLETDCFREMQLMYSVIEIPEGVTYLGGAFAFNEYNGMEVVLPSTLDTINGGLGYCDFKCELNLTDNIRYIAPGSFSDKNIYGTFHIPSQLKQIDGAFSNMGSEGSIQGEIEIPQGITSVDGAFGMALNKRAGITLPKGVKRIGRGWPEKGFYEFNFNDDLEEIGEACFWGYSMPFSIKLPSSLKIIGYRAFMGNGLEGELEIPEGCLNIAAEAFADAQITKLTLPSKLETIEHETFIRCNMLTKLTIPKFVHFIGKGAFKECGALQTVTCLNPEPPVLESEVFKEVYMDKVILEVPEQSVELYRRADGWKEFQNITAYHEQAFNIPEIVCLDKGTTRTGIIRSEGDWEVAECPDWVTVSPSSGEYKEELIVTVSPTTASREGRIVFRRKDKNYTTYTDVRQVVSDEYKEDETVVLQTASASAPKAIPLFIVGEGYGADDIASGQYLKDMKEQMEHLFSTEPYKSYRQYFTVSTAYACSPESGINGLTKFSESDDLVWNYAHEHGTAVTDQGTTSILVLCNTSSYGAHTNTQPNGFAVSWLGKNTDLYPYDQRGDVLHHFGGTAFGKLGPEYVNHFTFMKACTCPGCDMTNVYKEARDRGWWQNVSNTNKMNELPWQHLIFHEKYAQLVDIYEGALNHARGTYRSENQSAMGAVHVHYYNTISRQEIVRRIMQLSGSTFSVEQFIANDKIELPE